MHLRLFLMLLLPASLVAQQPRDSLIVDVDGAITVFHTLSDMMHDTVTATFHEGRAQRYSGVPLRTVLARAGADVAHLRGAALAQYVIVEAKDGYRVTFGVAALDTSLVGERVLLADGVDGGPLAEAEGRWRLVVVGDHGAARSARLVAAIRLRRVQP
jgi:DMSO/TMAO reductase YedYZ molybdopterin-dependent catalytic subunit